MQAGCLGCGFVGGVFLCRCPFALPSQIFGFSSELQHVLWFPIWFWFDFVFFIVFFFLPIFVFQPSLHVFGLRSGGGARE